MTPPVAAPEAAAGSIESQKTDVLNQESAETFPDILKNGPSSPKVTGTRRDRMGDEVCNV